ncbi:MAG TPA: Mrp/NBP35 family ATP-binding protein [Anaerolineaceae bacterium]|nr:Mrp/NBP35 family ATP-binding protein [Anaerolineaceae bacterium]
MTTEKEVLKALSTVIDPDLGKDLVSLNMIEDLKVDGKNVSFTVVLTTPACPLRSYFEATCRSVVLGNTDADHVDVRVTAKVGDKKQVTIDKNQFKQIIAVGSGKGGVGKSTVAVAIAESLALEGAKVGLLDADIYGPNIPRMLGIDGLEPVAEGQKPKPAEVDGMKVLSIGFFVEEGQPLIWRGPMLHSAIQQFLTDFDWGNLDYLIVDMPPGTGDVQLSLSQILPISGAVVVTTPQQVAVDDAARAIAMFHKMNIPVLGVVENMAYLELPDGSKMAVFGEGGGEHLAHREGVPFLGRIPLDPQIGLGGDIGTPLITQNSNSAAVEALRNITCALAAEASKASFSA